MGGGFVARAVLVDMPLVDNGYFENAAKKAAARKRCEFLMTVQVTRRQNGTSSKFNALGLFRLAGGRQTADL